ncbi:hypothetical protein [Arundinibacter roseus]|uniref:Uncharacterized protein n=1 Tax=Arundinibacter roseus TaxID=2070510 RepID=A0A4R4K9M9_9BACT|nr:hypothetical protein [Arundinibacter roseus]TDB64400.1 hypothetical protein EZE20_12005 [Arundinibacter roseus]
MIPAPVGFESLNEFLHRKKIDAEYIRSSLESYLGSYDHRQCDSDDLELDHQVWAYRQIIHEFVLILYNDSSTADTEAEGSAEPDGNESKGRPSTPGAARRPAQPTGHPAKKR